MPNTHLDPTFYKVLEVNDLTAKLKNPRGDIIEKLIFGPNEDSWESQSIYGHEDEKLIFPLIKARLASQLFDRYPFDAIPKMFVPAMQSLVVDEEKKVSPKLVADMITERIPIIRIAELDELRYYRKGCYDRGAEVIVQKSIENLLLGRASVRTTNEVIGHISRSAAISLERVNINSPLVCLDNGVLDVQTREFMPHDPERIFVHKLPIKYDPAARCPEIDRFVQEVAEPEGAALLYEVPGYCLQPDYPYQKAFLFCGPGNNGRSTYISLIRTFLGSENVSAVSLQSLVDDKFASSDLFGKYANEVADIGASDLKSSELFKASTGGDLIRAQFKYGQPFNFVNRAKLIFSANQVPRTEDQSDGFFRRWILPDFPNSFPLGSPDRDEHKLEKITTSEELSGLLNKALDSIDEVKRRGHFTRNDSIETVRLEWLRRSDSVWSFVQGCVEIDQGSPGLEEDGVYTPGEEPAKTLKEEVWAEYQKHCAINRVSPVTEYKFGRRLIEATYGQVHDGKMSKKDRRNVWVNLRLIGEADNAK